MLGQLSRWLIGDPIPSSAEVHQRLSKRRALAVFAADALSSVAYAPEEILLALALGSTMLFQFTLPIALSIVVLLIIVSISYYQTIHAYPSGGGAYTVAHENLGTGPGLLAAAALLIDYILVVAVSASAGIAAITSAYPPLIHLRVPLALIAITLVAWANLRGIRESSSIFALPTYGFVATLFLILAIGLVRILNGELPPVHEPHILPSATGGLSLILLLRSFASGTTALTGIEAISNGVPAFKPPESQNAGKTLLAMSFLLGSMFLGIVFMVQWMGITPEGGKTVLSQLGRGVAGEGTLYILFQIATTAILLLAANTSFADFPRLSAILARDRYMPRQLANLGDRLVFSWGIALLAISAGILVILFNADVHGLIPLYAVGVFLSFTLSQTGMVIHWKQERGRGWRLKAALNGAGALATGVVCLIIAASKFLLGAWIVILLIPAVVWIFRRVKDHYRSVGDQLSLKNLQPEVWTEVSSSRRHKVVVPISGMHRGTVNALRFARSLSQDVTAVVVDVEPEMTGQAQRQWPRWGNDIPLVVLDSPYRSTLGPLLEYLDQVDRDAPGGRKALIVLPEFIPARWWHGLLHNQTARLIKQALIYRRGHEGVDRILIDVPYHLTY